LDTAVNGRIGVRSGNRDQRMVPHGVYPVSGRNRWLAVACETDEQWARLASVIGRQDLAELDRDQREARRDELDQLITGWSSARPPLGAQELLQAQGVPAHQVQNSPECVTDPQYIHRDHFAKIPHPDYGHSWAEQFGFRLSATSGRPRRAGPTWGEHNEHIIIEMLGYDYDQLAELAINNVFV